MISFLEKHKTVLGRIVNNPARVMSVENLKHNIDAFDKKRTLSRIRKVNILFAGLSSIKRQGDSIKTPHGRYVCSVHSWKDLSCELFLITMYAETVLFCTNNSNSFDLGALSMGKE